MKIKNLGSHCVIVTANNNFSDILAVYTMRVALEHFPDDFKKYLPDFVDKKIIFDIDADLSDKQVLEFTAMAGTMLAFNHLEEKAEGKPHKNLHIFGEEDKDFLLSLANTQTDEEFLAVIQENAKKLIYTQDSHDENLKGGDK